MDSIFRITNGWPLRKKTNGFFFPFFLELCIQLKFRLLNTFFKEVCWHNGTNIATRRVVT